MIETTTQHQKAQEELRDLETRLARLQKDLPVPAKGLTKAGIRKMIARLHRNWPFTRPARKSTHPKPPREFFEALTPGRLAHD